MAKDESTTRTDTEERKTLLLETTLLLILAEITVADLAPQRREARHGR